MKYKNVLFIDDDKDDRNLFINAVNRISSTAKAIAMEDAEEALKKLSEKEIFPEVIFLDLNMPGMTGQEFLVEIKKREELRKIPIIIFSTTSHSPTIKLTKDLGATDFVTKPGTYHELVEILSKFIE